MLCICSTQPQNPSIPDEDIKALDWKVYQRWKKRAPYHPSLWLDEIYLGLVQGFRGDLPLDHDFKEDFKGDPLLDREFKGDLPLDHTSIIDQRSYLIMSHPHY